MKKEIKVKAIETNNTVNLENAIAKFDNAAIAKIAELKASIEIETEETDGSEEDTEETVLDTLNFDSSVEDDDELIDEPEENNAASVEVKKIKSNLYHVVTEKEIAQNEAYEETGEYDKVKTWEGKLLIYPVGKSAEIEMSTECQKTATAMHRFIKAYNKAAADGVIPELIINIIGDAIPDNEVELYEDGYKSIEEDDVHEFIANAHDLETFASPAYWYHERNENSHYIFIKADVNFEERRAAYLAEQNKSVIAVEDNAESVDITAAIEPETNLTVEDNAASVEDLTAIEEGIEGCKDGIKYYSRQIIKLHAKIANAENLINEEGIELNRLLNLTVKDTDTEDIKEGIEGCKDGIEYYSYQIIQFYAKIAHAENLMNEEGIELTRLFEKKDELQAKIASTRFSANIIATRINANAAAFITETVPLTFDLQAFTANNEDVEEVMQDIDTAITTTAIPMIEDLQANSEDEDEIKVEKFKAEFDDIDAQIAALQAKRKIKEDEFWQLIKEIEYWAYDEVDKAEGSTKLEVTAQSGSKYQLKKIDEKNWEDLYFDGYIAGHFRISKYSKVLAIYHSVTTFKAAIREFVEAIKRGDEKFTFPADEDIKA